MSEPPDEALTARRLVAERSLLLSSTLALLGAVRAHMSQRAETLRGSRPEPAARPDLGDDLLLAPAEPDERQARELACAGTRRTLARVRQRSLREFLA